MRRSHASLASEAARTTSLQAYNVLARTQTEAAPPASDSDYLSTTSNSQTYTRRPHRPSSVGVSSATIRTPSASTQAPGLPMLDVFDRAEAEFAGRARLRDRPVRTRPGIMPEILEERGSRRSSRIDASDVGLRHDGSHYHAPAEHNNSRHRLLRDGGVRPPWRPHGTSRYVWEDLLSENEDAGIPLAHDSISSGSAQAFESENAENQVPLPPFLLRSLRHRGLSRPIIGTIAREAGNYLNDLDLDLSYEGLLALGERIGDVKPRGAAEQALKEGLQKFTFKSMKQQPVPSINPQKQMQQEVRCGICLENYATDDVCARSNKCGHAMHSDCLEVNTLSQVRAFLLLKSLLSFPIFCRHGCDQSIPAPYAVRQLFDVPLKTSKWTILHSTLPMYLRKI